LALVLTTVAPASAEAATTTFTAALSALPTGSTPNQVVIADMNLDG
jgi:hypothetical protein